MLLGIPFIINVLFKIYSPIYLFEAEWSAGQWADYRNARTREEKDYLIRKWGRPKR